MNNELKESARKAVEMYNNDFKDNTNNEILGASEVFKQVASVYDKYADDYKSKSDAALAKIQETMSPGEQLALEFDENLYKVSNKETTSITYTDKDAAIEFLEKNFPLAVKTKVTKEIDSKVINDLLDSGAMTLAQLNSFASISTQLTLKVGKPKAIKKEEASE